MRISDWSSDVCSSDLFAELSVQFSQALNGIGGDLIVEPFALDEAGQFIEFAERDRRQFSYDDDLLFDRPASSPRARRMLLVSYCYLLVERGDYAIVRNAPFVIQQAHGFRPCRAVAILKKRPEQLCLLCCGKRMERWEERRVGKEGVSTCRSRGSP